MIFADALRGAALCLLLGTLTACPVETVPPDGGTCTEGASGCACLAGDRCDEGLACSAGTCQPCSPGTPGCTAGCEPGTEDCLCGAGAACNAGLVCVDGRCARDVACTEGSEGCTCTPDARCDDGLICADGACRACTAETCPQPECDGGTCAPVTCATLPAPCAEGEVCIEATETADAYCQPDGAGCPSCGDVGEVQGPGIRLQGGTCICQTQPGYYYSVSGSIGPKPCDADNDGWVRDSARFALQHSDPVLKANARCDLRTVQAFVLHNDIGQERVVPLQDPVPLFETVRNDNQSLLGAASQVPLYGPTRALRAAELNSLTKACVSDRADHNDNKLSDVAEWGRPPLQQAKLSTAEGLPADLLGHFEVYTRFSYFLELHRGWFEAGSAGGPGRYHIAEKDRTVGSSSGFPLRYGVEPVTGIPSSNFWQDCRRSRDVWYSEVTPAVGMDFASLSAPDPFWKGMNHHSQFKCVQVVDDAEYAGTDKALHRHVQTVASLGDPTDVLAGSGCVAGTVNCRCLADSTCNDELQCENASSPGGGVCRIPQANHLRATVNLCSLEEAPGPVTGGAPNPSEAALRCEPSLPTTAHEGKVVWAAVRLKESSQYARGCVLQCPGHPFICPGGNGNSCFAICGDAAGSDFTPLFAPQGLRVMGEVPSPTGTDALLGNPTNGFSIRKQ